MWEIGTEHWFQLRDDAHRLAAMEEHMSCIEVCFHTPDNLAFPFHYTLDIGPYRPRQRGRS